VLAWLNDDSTLRAYESANDAYAVFRKMLKRGNPPNSWKELLAAASDPSTKRECRQSFAWQWPNRGTWRTYSCPWRLRFPCSCAVSQGVREYESQTAFRRGQAVRFDLALRWKLQVDLAIEPCRAKGFKQRMVTTADDLSTQKFARH